MSDRDGSPCRPGPIDGAPRKRVMDREKMGKIMLGFVITLASCGVPETHVDGMLDQEIRLDEAALEAPSCTEVDPCVLDSLDLGGTVSVSWRVCCPTGGEAVAIVQVGRGPTWGGSDSVIVACGEAASMTLSTSGTADAWARIDTIEWPFTMDSELRHCGTAGAPND